MAKRKSSATVTVADGAGGMMKLEDRRFDRGDWPFSFEISPEDEQADRWTRYLSAECQRRGWSASSFGQLERRENSGTITVTGNGKPQLEIVWEHKREGALSIKARPAAASDLSLSGAKSLLDTVNGACRAAITQPIYVRGTLEYEGLTWRGELWLDDKTRLAPPSLQDETATLGPRIVHIDAMLDCVGEPDVPYARQQMLLEVSAFLSVVARRAFQLPLVSRAWVWTADMKSCEVRHLGYLEPSNPPAMPTPNALRQVPFYDPDNPPLGIGVGTTEIALRADIADLWKLYRSLNEDKRVQFLQAAAKWQEAMMHWQDRPSLSFTLMVIACEVLKLPNVDERLNCYDVIGALLGPDAVDRIRQSPYPAQRIRSSHLHTGEFHGSELEMPNFLRSYHDPSFREAHSEMAKVTPSAIIEWLKRQGVLELTAPKQRKNIRRLLREHLLISLASAVCIGLVIGWLLRTIY
jgi:hypothetical protein